MAKRRSRKGSLTRNQTYALIAVAVLIAGFMVYGDTITGMVGGTITFTVSGSPSVSLDDAAALLTTGDAGDTVWTTYGANEMHAENNGNTDLTCTIQSDEASYTDIFGGSGAGSPTFKYYSRNDEGSSATHTGSNASKAAMTYSGGSAANLVSTFQFEDTTDEIYIGFEHKIATDAVAASGDTTAVTILCS